MIWFLVGTTAIVIAITKTFVAIIETRKWMIQFLVGATATVVAVIRTLVVIIATSIGIVLTRPQTTPLQRRTARFPARSLHESRWNLPDGRRDQLGPDTDLSRSRPCLPSR